MALVLAATSCNLVLGIEEATPIDAESANACNSNSDCEDDNVCTKDSCDQGTCLNKKLNGPAAEDLQKPGDCLELVCQAGKLGEIVAKLDAPSDGKDCTADQCNESGEATYLPLAIGTPCAEQGGKVCDGAGQCVECTGDSDCAAPATCGGGGTASSCGCTPASCSSAALSCGEIADDGCGNALVCDNQMMDGNETDIDCGGNSSGCSRRCDDGQSCSQSLDCANSICDNQICDSGSWASGYGDNAFDAIVGLAVDANDAVFATGNFGGTIDLGGGALQSNGGQDIFLAKFDAYGRHQWSKSFGSTDEQRATSVAVDASGNVYLAGYYSNSVDFGGGALSVTQNDNWFVAKFDKDGAFIWNQTAGSLSVVQRANALAIDSQDHLIVAGYFAGSFTLANSSIQLTSQGSSDAFALKFDGSGTPIWGVRYGDSNEQRARSVAVDSSNNVILAGQYSGSMQFGSTQLVSNGNVDLWVAKLDSNGAPQWGHGSGDATSQCNGDCNIALATMSNDDVVLATDFQGTLNLGGGGLTSKGGTDIAIARLAPSGQHIFSLRLGNSEEQRIGAIVVDTSDRIFACATTNGPLVVGQMGGSTGNSDILVASLNGAGTVSAGSFFGDGANQACSGIAVDSHGKLRIGGSTNGSLDMKTSSPVYVAVGSGDAWLAKVPKPAP